MAVTNAELGKKLDAVLSAVQTTQIDVAELKISGQARQKMLDEHDKMLNGNGTPGLKASVAVLQEQMARLISASIAVASITGIQLVAIIVALLTHTLPGWTP